MVVVPTVPVIVVARQAYVLGSVWNGVLVCGSSDKILPYRVCIELEYSCCHADDVPPSCTSNVAPAQLVWPLLSTPVMTIELFNPGSNVALNSVVSTATGKLSLGI